MKLKGLISLGPILFLVILSGCGSGVFNKSYVRENANPALLERVAVLPFEGGGRAPRIRELAMTQLLDLDLFDVVDKGRVDVFLQQEGLGPTDPIDIFTMRRLGETLKAQAVLLGSVEEEVESRGSARFDEITMTMRLIDCQSGELVWQASGRGSGYSVMDRIFGFAPKDSFVLTLDLLEKLFLTMIQEG